MIVVLIYAQFQTFFFNRFVFFFKLDGFSAYILMLLTHLILVISPLSPLRSTGISLTVLVHNTPLPLLHVIYLDYEYNFPNRHYFRHPSRPPESGTIVNKRGTFIEYM